jgi:hypothetical protein
LARLIPAPPHDGRRHGHEKDSNANDIDTVARPQLAEVVAAQLFIDFAKDLAHRVTMPGASKGLRHLCCRNNAC